MVIKDKTCSKAQHKTIEVEIVYALPERQMLMKVQVPIGTTVEQAVLQSAILVQFPEIDLNKNRFGIFSRFVERDTVLQQCDRIEIYRPLLIDPKEARRLRVKQKRDSL